MCGQLSVLKDAQDNQRKQLVKEVISHARGHRRGVTGLRRVLKALQMGEVQTLVMAENFHARAVECSSCGYVDSHMVKFCHACGRSTLELEDVGDALIPMAIRRDIQLYLVKDNQELDNAGNIGALLRFRAERNQPMSFRFLILCHPERSNLRAAKIAESKDPYNSN